MKFNKKLTEDGKSILFAILEFDSGKKIHIDEGEVEEFEAILLMAKLGREIATGGLEFTCPDCKDHRLECVEDGPYTSEILNIDAAGDFDYGNINASGEVVRFQCLHCGYTLKSGDDNPLYDNEEVVFWIKEQAKKAV